MPGRKKLEKATGILAERQLPDGRRKISLRKNERKALVRQQQAERAAALFLDLNVDRTWADIAQEMGISPAQLRDLSKTQEFQDAYDQLFADIGHDPRYKAAKGALADMMPLAVRKLKAILQSSDTAPGTLLKAIEKVLELNGLNEPVKQMSDMQELVAFLSAKQINIQNMTVTLPSEYQEAMKKLEVVDAEARELPPAALAAGDPGDKERLSGISTFGTESEEQDGEETGEEDNDRRTSKTQAQGAQESR